MHKMQKNSPVIFIVTETLRITQSCVAAQELHWPMKPHTNFRIIAIRGKVCVCVGGGTLMYIVQRKLSGTFPLKKLHIVFCKIWMVVPPPEWVTDWLGPGPPCCTLMLLNTLMTCKVELEISTVYYLVVYWLWWKICTNIKIFHKDKHIQPLTVSLFHTKYIHIFRNIKS